MQLCVGTALKNENEVTGYLIGSYKYDLLNDVLSLLILGDTGSASIVNSDGIIIGDSDKQQITKAQNIYDLYPSSKSAKVFDKALSFQTGSALIRMHHRNHYIGYAPIPGTNWALLVNVPQREYMQSMTAAIGVSVILTLLLLITAAAIITPLARKISSSLLSATRRLQDLAEGDLTKVVVQSDSSEETLILTSALDKTIASLNDYIQSIQHCLGSLAGGDYTITIPDNFHGDFCPIRDSLLHITESLNQTMQQMNQSSIEVNQNSSGVSEHAKSLYDGSLNQAAVLSQLDESMADITSSIEKNKDNVLHIENCSKNATEKHCWETAICRRCWRL